MATPRQLEILEAIYDFTQKHNFPPTNRELAAIVGLASTSTMFEHFVRLRNNKLINYLDESPRTVYLTEAGYQAIGRKSFYNCN